MENNNQIINPEENKSSKDLLKLLIGIVIVIAALVALKFLAVALGVF